MQVEVQDQFWLVEQLGLVLRVQVQVLLAKGPQDLQEQRDRRDRRDRRDLLALLELVLDLAGQVCQEVRLGRRRRNGHS